MRERTQKNRWQHILLRVRTVTEADVGDGNASDFRVTKAQQKCATGLVLQNDVKVLLPNEAEDKSAVDNGKDYWKNNVAVLSFLVNTSTLRLLIPITPVGL